MRGNAQSGEPLERLAAAVVLQAVMDAKTGDAEALAWLAGDTGAIFCDYVGLDFDRVQLWALERARLARGDV